MCSHDFAQLHVSTRGTRDAMRGLMMDLRSLSVLVFAIAFAAQPACLTTLPDDDRPPAARVVVQWDPLACGEPHRVVLELEHDDGTDASSSVPCVIGSMTIDLPQWGIYFGRFYGWMAGEPLRREEPVTLTVDAPVIHWQLSEPP